MKQTNSHTHTQMQTKTKFWLLERDIGNAAKFRGPIFLEYISRCYWIRFQTRQWKNCGSSKLQWQMQIVKYFLNFYYFHQCLSYCSKRTIPIFRYLFSIISKHQYLVLKWNMVVITLYPYPQMLIGWVRAPLFLSSESPKWDVLRSRFQLKQIIMREREVRTKQMHLAPGDKGSGEVDVWLYRKSSASTPREGLGIGPGTFQFLLFVTLPPHSLPVFSKW